MVIMSLIRTIPAVMPIIKLRGEENKNHTEHFYSRAVSRAKVKKRHKWLIKNDI